METSPDQLNATTARQIPITLPAQLSQIGAILTGPGWQTVRQLTEILDDGRIVLRDMSCPLPPPDHTHVFASRAGVECACGAMVVGRAEILPVEGFPRAYLITSGDAPILTPDRWTVYLSSAGLQLRVSGEGEWISEGGGVQSIPIIPLLYPAWTLPEELRRFLR